VVPLVPTVHGTAARASTHSVLKGPIGIKRCLRSHHRVDIRHVLGHQDLGLLGIGRGVGRIQRVVDAQERSIAEDVLAAIDPLVGGTKRLLEIQGSHLNAE
jgi:cell division GTPase FtsZ